MTRTSLFATASGATPGWTLPTADGVPTGDDPATVDAFWRWLYEHYLSRHPNSALDNSYVIADGPQWTISWGGPLLQVLTVAVVLIVTFWLFAWFFNHPRRKMQMLYRPSSYAGTLTERHGRPSTFTMVTILAIVAWALYYPISHVISGQVY